MKEESLPTPLILIPPKPLPYPFTLFLPRQQLYFNNSNNFNKRTNTSAQTPYFLIRRSIKKLHSCVMYKPIAVIWLKIVGPFSIKKSWWEIKRTYISYTRHLA